MGNRFNAEPGKRKFSFDCLFIGDGEAGPEADGGRGRMFAERAGGVQLSLRRVGK